MSQKQTKTAQLHVKVFKNGNRSVRIPREFKFPGDYAIMRKEGNRLVIEPVNPKKSLLEVLATLKPLREEFPDIDPPLMHPAHKYEK